MEWRRTQKEDFPAIRRLWELAGYGFAFPDLASSKVISSWVAEEDGKIICWSGAQLQPELISILDPDWRSPHERLKLLGSFRQRFVDDLPSIGYSRVFATIDPKYPRLGEHLRRFGWLKGWEYWFWEKGESDK